MTTRPAVEGRSTVPDLVGIVGGALALAVSVWLVPASVYIVRWPASDPARVALLAPARQLYWLVAAALVAGMLTALWARRAAATRGVASVGWPLWLLGLGAVPYLPWLPEQMPLLLALAGPLRWGVAAAVVLLIVQSAWLHRGRGALSFPMPGRRSVFAVSAALYLLFGAMSARTLGPGGDEPHYLVIAHSLLADGDLAIENNHVQRDYRAFFGGELRPDYMTRGQDGQIYSIHAPGLPVLMLPAYAVAGYPGTLVFLCLLAALAALAMFDLADRLAGRRAAWVTWAAACLTVPFVPHAWLLFPEAPGALLVAWAALWLWQPVERRAVTWALQGAALGFMPWLHTKFVVFLAIFGLAFAWQLRRHPRRALAFFIPLGISGLAWLLSFYLIYGTFNPEAPYGDYPKLFVLARNIPRGLLGLLFDQKFGLLFYSPVFAFAGVGIWLMLRRAETRFLGLVLLAATAAFVGSTTRLYMWWGGSSAPARFLVPVVPLLTPMLAVAIAAATRPAARALLGLALAASLSVALIGAASPERLLLFSEPHGRGRIVETMQGAAPLALTLPTFTNEDWRTPLAALLPWLGAIAVAAVVVVAASCRVPAIPPMWLAVAFPTIVLVFAGAATARPAADVRDAVARAGSLQLLWDYDGERHRVLDYRRMRRVPDAEVMDLGVVSQTTAPFGPVTLPEGAYEARVWFAGGRAREGDIRVAASPRALLGHAAGNLPNPAVVPFELPVSLGRLTVDVGDAQVASGVVRVDIAPTRLVARSERVPDRVRAFESIGDEPDGFIVYLDQNAFPEGGVFWTRGTESTTILLAPAGASRARLTLHLGPEQGGVRVSIAGEERIVPVAADEISVVEVDLPGGMRLVPVSIESPVWFRPADVDPASGDMRRLGCQVRVELE